MGRSPPKSLFNEANERWDDLAAPLADMTLAQQSEGLTGMPAGLVWRLRAKSIPYQRPGRSNDGQCFGPLVLPLAPMTSAQLASQPASPSSVANDKSTYLQTHRFFSGSSLWNTPLPATESLVAIPDIGSYDNGLTCWLPGSGNVAIIYAHRSDPVVKVEYNFNTWTDVANGTWARYGNSQNIERQILATSSPIVPFPGNPYSTQVAGLYWNSTPSGLPASYDAWHQTTPLYIHAPLDAKPPSGWDGYTAIIQPDGTAVEMYAPIKLSNGTWVALMYSVTNALTGQGVGEENGRTASMVEDYAGVLRDTDVTSGSIDHALAITVPPSMLAKAFIGPALAFDSDSSDYAGTLPMGSHLALPRGLSLASLGLETSLGLEIARAAQDYGMFIVDRGGSGISVVTQDAPKTTALTTWSSAEQHDLDMIFKNTMLVHT